MKSAKDSAKKIAALAVMAALLTGGKMALSMVFNVEIVSLFCALFGYVFGPVAMIPVCSFVFIEVLIWGIGYPSWVIAYIVHFNLIAIVFWLLSKVNLKTPVVYALIIAFLTFLFGVFEAALNVLPVSQSFEDFKWRFGVYYGRGIAFCTVHIISNTAIFAVLFIPLKTVLRSIKEKMSI